MASVSWLEKKEQFLVAQLCSMILWVISESPNESLFSTLLEVYKLKTSYFKFLLLFKLVIETYVLNKGKNNDYIIGIIHSFPPRPPWIHSFFNVYTAGMSLLSLWQLFISHESNSYLPWLTKEINLCFFYRAYQALWLRYLSCSPPAAHTNPLDRELVLPHSYQQWVRVTHVLLTFIY